MAELMFVKFLSSCLVHGLYPNIFGYQRVKFPFQA